MALDRRGFLGSIAAALAASRLRLARNLGIQPAAPPAPAVLIFECEHRMAGGDWRHVYLELTQEGLDAIAPALEVRGPAGQALWRRELHLKDVLAQAQITIPIEADSMVALDGFMLRTPDGQDFEPGVGLSLVMGEPVPIDDLYDMAPDELEEFETELRTIPADQVLFLDGFEQGPGLSWGR